jgi:glycosyltransferase involved in cell wall biosynthesis
VHVVAPWHPLIRRSREEGGVRFHFYKYAPVSALNVFGYAAAMRADVTLRGTSLIAAPLALAQGWRMARHVARTHGATVMHGHWVIPGGVTAALAQPALPLVISLHGSDVFVAEKMAAARRAARTALQRAGAVTACSEDLARRAVALGADADRMEVVPYGVDASRFRPDAQRRARLRSSIGVGDGDLLIFAAGRLVRKKGFEYLIDAMGDLAGDVPALLAIGGAGDLQSELETRVKSKAPDRVRLLGNLDQDQVAIHLAAADIVVVPSVRDDAGNVDGLPNVVLEALASGTPLVTTAAGGIGTVVTDQETALVVPERDPAAIASAISNLARDPSRGSSIGARARAMVDARFGWARTAERMEAAYDRALALNSSER